MLRRKGRKRMRRSTGYKPRSVGRIKGRGWYGADLGTIGGALAGGYVGKVAGPWGVLTGAGIGSSAGGAAGHLIDAIAGHGAYNVQANSILARVQEGVQIPAFGNMKQATVIRHREFITDINANGGTAFTLLEFPLNPGLPGTFPWLSGVASNYDAYQVLGMVFEFKTTSSDSVSSSGGPLGSVIMSTDYDTVDSTYTSKLEMENSQYCVSSKPSLDVVHCIECAPAVSFSPIKFIRSGSVPASKDPRLYDHGNFQLATVGLGASSGNIGELWCTYEIALYKPCLNDSISFNSGAVTDHYNLTTQHASISATANYFGATGVIYTPDTGSTLNSTVSNSTLYMPVGITGSFLLHYYVLGSATTLTTAMTVAFTNSSGKNLFDNNASSSRNDNAGTTNENWLAFDACFSISAGQAAAGQCTVVLGAGTLPTSILTADLFVVQLANSMT